MNDPMDYVVRYLIHFGTVLFIARFLLQAARADFYNPISQGIVRATDPVLKPLRVVIPGFRNLDLAAFLIAVLLQIVLMLLLGAIHEVYPGNAVQIVANSTLTVVLFIIKGWWWAILIVIVASFIAPGSQHPALTLLSQITEPVLAPARKLLPPMGGLDFSPIIVFLLIGVLERVLPQFYL